MLLAAVSGDAARKPRLLLVDDHQDTRHMYLEFLSADFEVEECEAAAAALTRMRVHPPDLLVTDLSLPGMDGFELITLIREDPTLEMLPIICLSGYGGHAHESRARAAGCDVMLLKPCMPDELAAAASELLRRSRLRSVKP